MSNLAAKIYAIATLPPKRRNAMEPGITVDRAGVEGVNFVFSLGEVTDGEHTFIMQTSADGINFEDVDPREIVSPYREQISAVVSIPAGKTEVCAYVGYRRYVRIVHNVVGATVGAESAAYIVLNAARYGMDTLRSTLAAKGL